MKQNKGAKNDPSSMIEQVINIFQEMNKIQNASKVQLFDLVKLFRQEPIHFQQAWELAYLKIFKIFHQKANRKMPSKFEQLATNFFSELLPPANHSDPPAEAFFDFFIDFLAEAVFSTLIGIRITAARMIFHLLKAHPRIGEKSQERVLRAVFYLVRLKVSTYKQIGIKLASIVLGWDGSLKQKIEEEMFRILAVDQNQQIRKMAITNVWLSTDNIDKILLRLRDKCSDIRSIVIRKLVGQKLPCSQITLSNRYKLLFDGYGNKESSVQQDTIKYFLKHFEQSDINDLFFNFITLFEPNTLLAHPHLYSLFNCLIADMIEEFPHHQLSDFMRRFTGTLKNIGKGNQAEAPLLELIWLKNVGRSENSDLRSLFEETIPSGIEFSHILTELVSKEDQFSMYQCLQIFSLLKGADEVGRNHMYVALETMVDKLSFWQIKRSNISSQKDDICPNLTQESIKQKKMLLSYFDMPPISCSFDLLNEAGRTMQTLRPKDYQIGLKQLMSDWNNPEENILLKERQNAKINIKKAEGKESTLILEALQAKLAMIQEQIERRNLKTIIIIQTIVRLRPQASMDDYMPIIKQELAKTDQSQGLVLLGLYCLEELERVQNFLPLYWAHLANPDAFKLPLLIALKVTSDFFIKFDFTQFTTQKDGDQPQFSYAQYLKKVQKLVISSDPDTRILAIEGLCRLLFHNRIPEDFMGSCFIRLLFLWWETSSEEISARSVHTISIFIKQYIEKGQSEVRKLSEWLCVFFKIVLVEQSSRKTINKKKIVYNLKLQQFIRRAVLIAMTVLKYQKESKQVIWRYQQTGAELGPQELFLIFLLTNKNLHFCLDKILNLCDFYEQAPLQTLILTKKCVQTFLEEESLGNAKKLETSMKRLQSDLEQRIQIKNKQTFNEQLLNGLKEELHQYKLLIDSAANTISKELESEDIFIEATNISQNNEEEVEIQIESSEGEEQEVELEELIESKEQSKGSRKEQKKSLRRISEQIQAEEKDDEQPEEGENKKKRGNARNEKKNNRKRRLDPPSEEESPLRGSLTIEPENTISVRTRSRHQV